jgi:hypothetical protein
LLAVVLDGQVQVVVRDILCLRERTQLRCEPYEHFSVAAAFYLELMQRIDEWASGIRCTGPEGGGEVAADEIEVEIDEPLFALAGEVARNGVRAGKARSHVFDDSAVLGVSTATFGLSLLKCLCGGLVRAARHKFAPRRPV